MSMSLSDIILFFKEEFKLDLHINDLKNPTVDIACGAFRCLTSAIFGLQDNVFAPDENAPHLPLQVIVRLMQSVVEDVTPDQCFVITDLVMPTPKRFRYYLGCLIEFYKFIRLHVGEVDSLFEEMTQLKNKLEDDRTAIARLGDEIGKQKQRNELAKRTRLELTSKLNHIEAQLANSQKAKEQIKEKVNFIEESIKKKEEKKAKLELDIELEDQELRRISSDIVSSPDRLFNEIARNENELKNCQEAIEQYKKQIRESHKMISDAENFKMTVDDFTLETKTLISQKFEIVQKQNNIVKKSDAHLQACQQAVIDAERNLSDCKIDGEEKIRKQQSEITLMSEKIEYLTQKLLNIQEEINHLNQVVGSKNTKHHSEELSQWQQAYQEMEFQFNSRKNSLQQQLKNFEDFIIAERQQLHYNTELYERCKAAIEKNKDRVRIATLLAEHDELVNKKRDLDRL